jgi:hypothetical protein
MVAGRSLFRAAGLLLAASWFAATTASAEPLAVLAAVKGQVEVVSAKDGSPQSAAFGRALQSGDRIVVPPDGAATVFFHDGNVIELGPNTDLTIGAPKRPEPKSGGAPGLPGEVYASVTKFVTGGSRETGLVALSSLRAVSDSAPFLLEPRKTEVLDGRPTFRWRAVDGATRYQVTLSGEQGEVWTRETEETVLEYPSDAPALEADADFLWAVRALSDEGEMRREESYFHVLPAKDAEEVRHSLARIGESVGGTDRPAAWFLSGSYLFGHGLFCDAAEQFETLSRSYPKSPAAHEALGNVYRAVGLMDLAAAEYQRALRLSREP